MALLGLGEGLEPVGDLVVPFLPGGTGHARVHVGVLVGLAGEGGLQVPFGLGAFQCGPWCLPWICRCAYRWA